MRLYLSSFEGPSPKLVVAADGSIHGHTVGRQSDGGMTPGWSGARAILFDDSPLNGTWLPRPYPEPCSPNVRIPVVELAAGRESMVVAA